MQLLSPTAVSVRRAPTLPRVPSLPPRLLDILEAGGLVAAAFALSLALVVGSVSLAFHLATDLGPAVSRPATTGDRSASYQPSPLESTGTFAPLREDILIEVRNSPRASK